MLSVDFQAERMPKYRLELTMLIEDQFTGLEISDDDVDQIELVGDLIRHIKHG